MVSRSILSATVFVVVGAVVAGLLVGCGSDSTGDSGRLRLVLTDAPLDALSLDVTISRVDVVPENGDPFTIVDVPQAFDLLTLAAAETLLGEAELPAGIYGQIRLIVTQASITTDEGTFDVFVPSGMLTGIKLVHQFEISPDTILTLILDFDAGHSIIQTPPGSDNYLLKPVIHVIPQNIAGYATGTIQPAGALPTAEVKLVDPDTGDTVASTLPNPETGAFTLVALAGTYDLEATAEGYETLTVPDVEIVTGETADLGVLTLTEVAPG